MNPSMNNNAGIVSSQGRVTWSAGEICAQMISDQVLPRHGSQNEQDWDTGVKRHWQGGNDTFCDGTHLSCTSPHYIPQYNYLSALDPNPITKVLLLTTIV